MEQMYKNKQTGEIVEVEKQEISPNIVLWTITQHGACCTYTNTSLFQEQFEPVEQTITVDASAICRDMTYTDSPLYEPVKESVSKPVIEQIKEVFCNDCDFKETKAHCHSCSADNETDKFLKWLNDNGYVQLQGDSEGLLGEDNPCKNCALDICQVTCRIKMRWLEMIQELKAEKKEAIAKKNERIDYLEIGLQEADGEIKQLKQEKAEAVKKVFEWIDNRGIAREADDWLFIPNSDYEAFKSKTLEK